MLINVSDHTGQLYLNCFDDVGRLLTGTSADQLMELQQNEDKAVGDIIQNANCRTWTFGCRAKIDHYGDQQR
jgi:replication factor A1